MKKDRIIYWTTTVIFSLVMLMSAYNYLNSVEMKAAFVHLGFPDYFRVELAVAKFLGVIALLVPGIPKVFKQFAYAGFAVNLVSASIAHFSKGDPVQAVVTPVVFGVILFVSYHFYNKLNAVSK